MVRQAPLPQIQVRHGEQFSWASGFLQYDNQIQQLAASAAQALHSSQGFRQYGPRIGQQLLPQQLNDEIRQALSKNWFWEPGVTTIKLVCNSTGSQYELVRTVTLTKNQVNAMQQIADFYGAGYGVIIGTELISVGPAQPGQKVTAEGG